MKQLFFTFLIAGNLYSAFEVSNSNSFLSGIANSSIATDHFFSAYLINPAVSASLHNINIGLSYYNPFGIQGLNYAGVVANIPFRNMGAGLSIFTFGGELYRENQLTLNFSGSLLENRFQAGFNLKGYLIHAKHYGNIQSLGIDVGMQYKLSPQFYTGFSVQNINQPALNGNQEEIPFISSWGFSFKPDNQFSTYLAVQKDAWFPVALLIGVDFRANSVLSVQSGLNTHPSVPSAGFRLRWNQITVNYVFQYHFDLGATHFWGISFTKNQAESHDK